MVASILRDAGYEVMMVGADVPSAAVDALVQSARMNQRSRAPRVAVLEMLAP